jgi:hypothetical protein
METKETVKKVKASDAAARELPKDTAKIILVVLAVLMANV